MPKHFVSILDAALTEEQIKSLRKNSPKHGITRQCGVCGEKSNPMDPHSDFQKCGEDYVCKPCRTGILGLPE